MTPLLHPQSYCNNLTAFRCVICCPGFHSGGQPTVYRFVQNLPVSDLGYPDSDALQLKFSFACVVLELKIVLRSLNVSSNDPSLIYQAMILEGGQGFGHWAMSDATRN